MRQAVRLPGLSIRGCASFETFLPLEDKAYDVAEGAVDLFLAIVADPVAAAQRRKGARQGRETTVARPPPRANYCPGTYAYQNLY
jgi:hypothetical protein